MPSTSEHVGLTDSADQPRLERPGRPRHGAREYNFTLLRLGGPPWAGRFTHGSCSDHNGLVKERVGGHRFSISSLWQAIRGTLYVGVFLFDGVHSTSLEVSPSSI